MEICLSDVNEKNGYWEYFWDNGQVYFKGNWKKGLMHGDWQSYYPTGRLLGAGCYKNGLRDGKFSSYHDNGNLECEGSFKDGKRIGSWRFYNNNGFHSYSSSLLFLLVCQRQCPDANGQSFYPFSKRLIVAAMPCTSCKTFMLD